MSTLIFMCKHPISSYVTIRPRGTLSLLYLGKPTVTIPHIYTDVTLLKAGYVCTRSPNICWPVAGSLPQYSYIIIRVPLFRSGTHHIPSLFKGALYRRGGAGVSHHQMHTLYVKAQCGRCHVGGWVELGAGEGKGRVASQLTIHVHTVQLEVAHSYAVGCLFFVMFNQQTPRFPQLLINNQEWVYK